MSLAVVVGCDFSSASPPTSEVDNEYEQALIASARQPEPAPDWVRRVGQIPSSVAPDADWKVVPATLADVDYASDEPVTVRRLVYRVRLVVPPILRQRRRQLRAQAGGLHVVGAQAGELHVDVGVRRLRARFVGPGWPLHSGAEIRLREDRPGVYLFDGNGGRWIGPGALASWFEGRQVRGVRSGIRVLRDYSPVLSEGPGALVCALLSEWTNQPRDSLAGRCRGNVIPPGFRFGPWRAELTAVLPMELPRRQLRADERQPPDRPKATRSRPMLADAEMEQLAPKPPPADAQGPTIGALMVHNHTATRVIIVAQGVPLGFVDAGASGSFARLRAGAYRVGALRPFGMLSAAPSLVVVPGELHVGRIPGVPDAPSVSDTLTDSARPDPTPNTSPRPDAGKPVSPGPGPLAVPAIPAGHEAANAEARVPGAVLAEPQPDAGSTLLQIRQVVP